MGHPITGSHPTSSETATSSPKNILSNGIMDRQLHSRHCHLNGNIRTEDWESNDELCDESEWSGDEVEHGQVLPPHDGIYFSSNSDDNTIKLFTFVEFTSSVIVLRDLKSNSFFMKHFRGYLYNLNNCKKEVSKLQA